MKAKTKIILGILLIAILGVAVFLAVRLTTESHIELGKYDVQSWTYNPTYQNSTIVIECTYNSSPSVYLHTVGLESSTNITTLNPPVQLHVGETITVNDRDIIEFSASNETGSVALTLGFSEKSGTRNIGYWRLTFPCPAMMIDVLYNGSLTTSKGYAGAFLQAKFYTNNGVLYNCKAIITYQATNGSVTQITKQLGSVDINAQNVHYGFELDWPVATASTTTQFTQASQLADVNITAYGYVTPYSS